MTVRVPSLANTARKRAEGWASVAGATGFGAAKTVADTTSRNVMAINFWRMAGLYAWGCEVARLRGFVTPEPRNLATRYGLSHRRTEVSEAHIHLRAWRGGCDGHAVDDAGGAGACGGGDSRRPVRVPVHGGAADGREARGAGPRACAARRVARGGGGAG